MKIIPETCMTCQFEKRCPGRLEAAKYFVFKCTSYQMSDECIICKSCPDERCYSFGKCKFEQGDLNL